MVLRGGWGYTFNTAPSQTSDSVSNALLAREPAECVPRIHVDSKKLGNAACEASSDSYRTLFKGLIRQARSQSCSARQCVYQGGDLGGTAGNGPLQNLRWGQPMLTCTSSQYI